VHIPSTLGHPIVYVSSDVRHASPPLPQPSSTSDDDKAGFRDKIKLTRECVLWIQIVPAG